MCLGAQHATNNKYKEFFDSLSEDWWLLDEKVEVVFTADLPVTMMHRAFEAPSPLSSHLKTKVKCLLANLLKTKNNYGVNALESKDQKK